MSSWAVSSYRCGCGHDDPIACVQTARFGCTTLIVSFACQRSEPEQRRAHATATTFRVPPFWMLFSASATRATARRPE
jgi:hypothetical protein